MPSIRVASNPLRRLAVSALALALPFAAIDPVQAQKVDQWPNKPIRFIMPFVPGGGTDLVGRTIAPKLSEALGQQVVVENRGGAGGNIGVEIATRADPDGYTMVLGTIGNIAVNPSLYGNLSFDPIRDLDPVSQTSLVLNFLAVHPSVPVNNVKELIDYARKNPGKVTFGSSGMGAADHLAGELFNRMAGVQMVHVPYKGGGPAMLDLIGGNITLSFTTVVAALPHWKAGKLRPIAFTLPQRTALFPDIPTVAESGIPGFSVQNWYGVFVPAKTPRPIIERLNVEINKALKLPDIIERHNTAGIIPVGSTSEALGKFVREETARFAKLVKEAGLRPE
ncbi:MAG: tripartite tricarboxylate transporter substrate binding protein [Proteobacteria bacterium]|nr:tripartite tricarboxylate transporter substrate binding protein [Burkholderiales bacterium]